jgi:predicted membrane chloride channel (bestrophin family)
LGIENIGCEIEDPFGYDDNDLDLESFTEQLKEELAAVSQGASRFNCEKWTPL